MVTLAFPTEFARFGKFAVAGAGGLIVQLVTVSALLEMNVHYLIATVIGIEAAVITNFFSHQYWTWRDRGACGALGASGASVLERFLRYHAVASLTSVLGSVFLSAYLVEASGLHPLVANVLSITALGAINFISADRLVFKTPSRA
jgi:putative flippase GtrA